jgi:hypothetical protein
MALSDYIVKSDKFVFDEDDRIGGLAFPCKICIHRHGSDRDEPCRSCGHNSNAKLTEN